MDETTNISKTALAARLRRLAEAARPRSALQHLKMEDPEPFLGAAAQVLAEDEAVDPRDLETGHIRDVGRPKNPDGKDAKAITETIRNQLTWRRAFLPAKLSYEDLHPYRVRVVWRITRELGRCMGMVHGDETILSGVSAYYPEDPWSEPVDYVETGMPPNTGPLRARFHDLVRGEDRKRDGLALLPPPVPHSAVEGDYDPHQDERLMRYISVMKCIADSLNIARGSANDPDLGRFGLKGLFNPVLTRPLWPTRTEIVTFEQMVVDEATTLLIDEGYMRTRTRLIEEYGLHSREAKDITTIARLSCRQRTEGVDLEDERALHILRLEELANRARNSLDHRAELAAYKQIAIVLGLGRAEPEDTLKDFVEVIKKVEAEDVTRKGLPEPDFE